MSFKVFGIGEVLWDLLPTGRQLGGAPANFTFHARNLGADAALITRIGDDGLGQEALRKLKKYFPRTLIQIDDRHPTGVVEVAFPSHGNPRYTISQGVAWDYLAATQPALSAVQHADAICFGSLSQRSPTSCFAIYELLQAAPDNTLKIFDINLRQDFFTRSAIEKSLQLANMLKLNFDEMDQLCRLFQINGTPRQKILWLARSFNLQTVALTLGAEGSMLYHGGQWSIEHCAKVDIVDTIGAGDSFTAALVTGLLHGLKPSICHRFATEVSGYVCSQTGGMPSLPTALTERLGT